MDLRQPARRLPGIRAAGYGSAAQTASLVYHPRDRVPDWIDVGWLLRRQTLRESKQHSSQFERRVQCHRGGNVGTDAGINNCAVERAIEKEFETQATLRDGVESNQSEHHRAGEPS